MSCCKEGNPFFHKKPLSYYNVRVGKISLSLFTETMTNLTGQRQIWYVLDKSSYQFLEKWDDSLMSFEAVPVPKNAVAEDIVTQLLSMIRKKKLRPGDRLPPERELALMLHVSRPSLREALRTLSVMRVIHLRHGSGSYVTSLEPAALVEHLDFVFSLDDSSYLQLFETRKILEPAICALAAQHITDPELALLDDCVIRSANGSANYEEYIQADLDLHEIIVQAARNPLLQRFMQSIRSLGRASRARTSALPGIVEQTTQDHKAIVQALRQHQSSSAQQAMLTHLEHVEQRLQQDCEAI
jgi:GntR family transcriptional regulator, transcriptional repressor for pyruvate dehydrogenase complex